MLILILLPVVKLFPVPHQNALRYHRLDQHITCCDSWNYRYGGRVWPPRTNMQLPNDHIELLQWNKPPGHAEDAWITSYHRWGLGFFQNSCGAEGKEVTLLFNNTELAAREAVHALSAYTARLNISIKMYVLSALIKGSVKWHHLVAFFRWCALRCRPLTYHHHLDKSSVWCFVTSLAANATLPIIVIATISQYNMHSLSWREWTMTCPNFTTSLHVCTGTFHCRKPCVHPGKVARRSRERKWP